MFELRPSERLPWAFTADARLLPYMYTHHRLRVVPNSLFAVNPNIRRYVGCVVTKLWVAALRIHTSLQQVLPLHIAFGLLLSSAATCIIVMKKM